MEMATEDGGGEAAVGRDHDSPGAFCCSSIASARFHATCTVPVEQKRQTPMLLVRWERDVRPTKVAEFC